jgi:hypothetical protein
LLKLPKYTALPAPSKPLAELMLEAVAIASIFSFRRAIAVSQSSSVHSR